MRQQQVAQQQVGVDMQPGEALPGAESRKTAKGRSNKGRAAASGSIPRLGALPERLKAKARQPRRAATTAKVPPAAVVAAAIPSPAPAGAATVSELLNAAGALSGSGKHAISQQKLSQGAVKKQQKVPQADPGGMGTRTRRNSGGRGQRSKATEGLSGDANWNLGFALYFSINALAGGFQKGRHQLLSVSLGVGNSFEESHVTSCQACNVVAFELWHPKRS
jgi:hypothetical protein